MDLTLDAMRSHGSVALQDTKTLTTSDGALTVAIVTSPCDNVIHTLVNTKHYSGQFLPGFKPVVHNRQFNGEQQQQQQQQFGSDIKLDHLTYVCRPGESRHILDWYKTCCGMERLVVLREAAKKVIFLMVRPLRPYPSPLQLSGHPFFRYILTCPAKPLFNLYFSDFDF